jgi:hypothetical protein
MTILDAFCSELGQLKAMRGKKILGGVGHCFAWHVRVSLGLYFNSNLKQKNLYIVMCVQCDIWDITAYFLLPELKYHYENK